jgi:hypothetical protein
VEEPAQEARPKNVSNSTTGWEVNG